MPTPQFDNNRYQIKAKPIIYDTPGNLLSNKPTAFSRSVFSPIPCKPQSEYSSILGNRGDRNAPYSPFSRQNDNITPSFTQVFNHRRGETRKQVSSTNADD